MLPRRSLTSIRPSGKKATSQGRLSPVWITVAVSTGGAAQAGALTAAIIAETSRHSLAEFVIAVPSQVDASLGTTGRGSWPFPLLIPVSLSGQAVTVACT